jgi:hypothetical protein
MFAQRWVKCKLKVLSSFNVLCLGQDPSLGSCPHETSFAQQPYKITFSYTHKMRILILGCFLKIRNTRQVEGRRLKFPILGQVKIVTQGRRGPSWKLCGHVTFFIKTSATACYFTRYLNPAYNILPKIGPQTSVVSK